MNNDYRQLRIGEILNKNDEIYTNICYKDQFAEWRWIKIPKKYIGEMVNGTILAMFNLRRPIAKSLGAIKPNTELENENFKFVRDNNISQQSQALNGMDTNKAKSDKKELNYHQISPEAIRRLAFIFSEGAKKYGKDNFKKGFNDPDWINERYDHAMDHLLKWKSGDRSADHLAKVMWFAVVMIEFETEELNKKNVNEKNYLEIEKQLHEISNKTIHELAT